MRRMNEILVWTFILNLIYVFIYCVVIGFRRDKKIDGGHVIMLMFVGVFVGMVTFFCQLLDNLEGMDED